MQALAAYFDLSFFLATTFYTRDTLQWKKRSNSCVHKSLEMCKRVHISHTVHHVYVMHIPTTGNVVTFPETVAIFRAQFPVHKINDISCIKVSADTSVFQRTIETIFQGCL